VIKKSPQAFNPLRTKYQKHEGCERLKLEVKNIEKDA